MTLTDLAITCEATAADALGELPDDVETLAHMLVDARKAQRALGDTARMIETKLAEVMTSKVVTIEGLGTFEKRGGKDRKRWEWDRLTDRLLALSRDERQMDFDTGEVEPEGQAVMRVIRECLAFSYARVGELRKRGLDPDEYATVEPGRLSVQVTT